MMLSSRTTITAITSDHCFIISILKESCGALFIFMVYNVKNRMGGLHMEFETLIRQRYSCKNYTDRKVDEETLQKILEAGRLAPTAKNLQEQMIYVLESEKALTAFDSVCPCRYGAPTVLVAAYDENNVFTYPGNQVKSGMEDVSIVAAHMILAAADAGVDSCWLNYFDPEKMAQALGLPANLKVVMAMDLGYASEKGKPLPNHAKRKDLKETVRRI